MLKFTAYIEYLLMTQHYCYVPGHGAYMLSEEPALIDAIPSIGAESRRLSTLQAPRRVIHFSPLHTHDDGILANLLMEAEGMTYDEACRYIERQVPQLPTQFTQEAMADIDTDNYGFESLHIETWADIEARQQRPAEPEPAAAPVATQPHDTIAIPRVWLQRAAMILLVALFFFCNFIGLNKDDAQLASVIDITLLQRSGLRSEIELNDETVDDSLLVEAPVVKTITEASSVPSSAVGKHYYIIIASTVSEAEAQAICQRYSQQGFSGLGILAKKNLYRVYTASFADKNEAVSYLRALREAFPRLQKSWMLPLEEGSLSYIIKEQYNDNQLSMELSHPNQRTERDQG